VAIITGAGEKASRRRRPQDWIGRQCEWRDVADAARQLLNRGLEVWKPVIAAVNGYCLGGGMTLLLATDIRVRRARHLRLSEVKRGIIAGNGGTQRMIQNSCRMPSPWRCC
jgi:E-phenylitaconyl-CoA hydratase